MRDPVWAALLEADAKANPRLEERFGYCPICLRTATSVLPLGPIAWAICDCCACIWPAGEHLLDVQQDALAYEAVLYELSRFTVVPPGRRSTAMGAPATKGPNRMTQTAIPITDFDPWPNAQIPAPREPSRALHEAPSWWSSLERDTRARLFGIALAAVAEFPEVQTGRRTDRASGILSAQMQAGDPVAIRLSHELRRHHHPNFLIELMERLMRAGGAIPVLEMQRQQINEQLARLRTVLRVSA